MDQPQQEPLLRQTTRRCAHDGYVQPEDAQTLAGLNGFASRRKFTRHSSVHSRVRPQERHRGGRCCTVATSFGEAAHGTIGGRANRLPHGIHLDPRPGDVDIRSLPFAAWFAHREMLQELPMGPHWFANDVFIIRPQESLESGH